jgi:hypothetical protein
LIEWRRRRAAESISQINFAAMLAGAGILGLLRIPSPTPWSIAISGLAGNSRQNPVVKDLRY